MEEDKEDTRLATVQLLQFQERTPPNDFGINKTVHQSSKSITEKHKQERKRTLSPKCLALNTEVHRKISAKRQRKVSEASGSENVLETKACYEVQSKSLPGSCDGLSPYEWERLENVQKNQAFLKSLNLSKISKELKPKPIQKVPKKDPTKLLPIRKSLRLQSKIKQNVTASGQKLIDNTAIGHLKSPRRLTKLDTIREMVPESWLNLWNEVIPKNKPGKMDVKLYQEGLQKLTIDEACVAQVVGDRVSSAAFHPSPSLLLVAAGDQSGQLGIWQLDARRGDGGVFGFHPHSCSISHLAFSSDPCSLITVGFDGVCRSLDVERAVFDEVYCSSTGLTSFDFLSNDCSSLLIGAWNGDVAIVDRRTPGTSHKSLYKMDWKSLRGLHVHPLQKQYFVAAQSSFVNVYDLRNTTRRMGGIVSELHGHFKSVSSVFFSPFTGNSVLTTCEDNNIRVFDTSEMITCAPLQQSIRHHVQKTAMAKHQFSKLSAVWDPKQEDCFVIGSMANRFQVYHESGRLLHTFRNKEHLTSVCPVTAFHPSRPALLGGSSNGTLHVFTDQH